MRKPSLRGKIPEVCKLINGLTFKYCLETDGTVVRYLFSDDEELVRTVHTM